MNIAVEILESETTTSSGGGSVIRRPKAVEQKKADAKLISVYENSLGHVYGVVVMSDGSIRKIQYDLLKVVDNQYL